MSYDKPTVPQLCTGLASVTNWQSFAIRLPGIRIEHVTEIESNHRGDNNRQKMALFEKWLGVCPGATWGDVNGALVSIDEVTLANSLGNQLVPDVDSRIPSKQPSPLLVQQVAGTKHTQQAVINCTNASQPVEETDGASTRQGDSGKDIGQKRQPNMPRKVIPAPNKSRVIAVNSEGVMVVGGEGTNCITVMDKDGGIVRSFGLDKRLSNCSGISFTTDGHIIVGDFNNHKLHKQGEHIASVGGRGSGPLEFNYPNETSIHPTTGQIYVADSNNHRIQVINDDFTYSHSIGSEGTALGQLQRPCDVALDSAGNVYVCNTGNVSIDVFTSDGTFIRRFGSKGSGDGQLGGIVSIAVDSQNLVYVADSVNNCISIFDINGEFKQSIGSEIFSDPEHDTTGIMHKITSFLESIFGLHCINCVNVDVSGKVYAVNAKKNVIAIF